ncbi:MAG TPA: M28 family peptidase, partial [Gemmatimonadaceae bacterium]|nr:M28 family peptidase [Gemmatimonadaceae bacterium]
QPPAPDPMTFSRTALLALLLTAACDAQSRPRTAFDGQAALGYVRTQVAFGPRVPGTAGHRRAGDWIVAQMRTRADTVLEQRWTHVTIQGDSLPMRNVMARIRPELPDRVLYVAHWDTRPIADYDADPTKRRTPIAGANDGGSGVALLIGVADALRKTPPTVGVDLLFVDGEDYGRFGDLATHKDVLIGATRFAEQPPVARYQPLFGVVWDMIGDADLQILQETQSMQGAPEVVQRVWRTAAELGYGHVFLEQSAGSIDDDHVPMLRRGMRVIDVIDLKYGPLDRLGNPSPNYHHTTQDTIDKVSARSLQIVGDVAVALVTSR